MKILSLFDGISCARIALKKAKIPVDVYYSSEIEDPAIKIAQKRFPETVQLGDIKTLNKRFDMNKNFANGIDLMIGGSPCQDLSIAKTNREGLKGKRSGLFYEYLRILKEVKPKYFILENVASMPKEAKAEITKCLGVEPIMINANLVSAQNRKRLFWTNIKGVTLPKDKEIFLKDILQPEKEIDEKYYIKDATLKTILEKMLKGKPIAQAFRIRSIQGKSVTLQSGGGGTGTKTGLYWIVPEATKKGYAIAKDGDSIDLSFPNSSTRRGRVGDRAKNLMTTNNIAVFTKGRVRKLTPIECERLQGLPDGYTNGGDTSDNQRYKVLGNAFNADVIAHILSFIPKQK